MASLLCTIFILPLTQLDEELEVLHAAFDQAKTELKATEARLKEVNRSLHLLSQYYHTKEAYLEYKKSKNKKGSTRNSVKSTGRHGKNGWKWEPLSVTGTAS